jgi:anaerobic magnesium-protoporphyrin IX monomethyl ester cyclase
MKKILFITAPYHANVVEVAGRWVPLYYVYLGGAAREAGFEVEIYDAMTKKTGFKEVEEKIRQSKPDYVGVMTITCTSPDALETVKLVKKVDPSITTIMGGIHSSFMYDELFDRSEGNIDFIVRGEGEKTIAEFLQAHSRGASHDELATVKGLVFRKEGKTVAAPARPLMEPDELETLPKAWEALDWNDYTYYILPGTTLGALDTSRGCDKDCSFCSQRLFWEKRWRGRSPESLLRDIEEQKKFGVDVILLTDDYPTLERERWETFLDMLIERETDVYFLMETRVEDIIRDKDILWKYRKAGIIHIYVGIESTDDEVLEKMKKGITVDQAKEALKLLDEADIITETSMILGMPDETPESIEKTIEYAIFYNPDFCHFLAICPWPYADLYEELEPHIESYDYRKYNLIDPVVKPKNMTLKEIDEAIVDCYRRFYMGKLNQIKDMKNEFRKGYLLHAMDRVMKNSFLVNKIGSLGEMPPEVKASIDEISGETNDHFKGDPSKCPITKIKKLVRWGKS